MGRSPCVSVPYTPSHVRRAAGQAEPSLTLPPLPTHMYLHDPIPVVTGGDLEEREEGHAEVLEGGVSAHALTRVLIVADWKDSGVNLARCRVPCGACPTLLPLSLISDNLRGACGLCAAHRWRN